MAAAGETVSLFGVQHACFRIFGPLELVGSEKRRNSDVQQKFASFCLVGLGVCGQVM